jgi:hypothetical protein
VGEILPEERFLAQALAEAAGMVLSRIEALETARLEAERYKAFLDLTLALEASREPLAMAQEALETLLRLTPYHGGALYLFQEGVVRPAVMAGRYPPDFPRLYEVHPIRFGEGLLGPPQALGGAHLRGGLRPLPRGPEALTPIAASARPFSSPSGPRGGATGSWP